jgi:Asp-tRNA(Asn)/Glu-tRNA(Gln) amidotransferase A subunit family amidase
MRLRGPMKDAMNDLYAKFDAVVTPGRATVAYPADVEFAKAWPGFSGGPPVIPAGNLCGLPALCLPTGLGDEGLPTSIAFMGPAFSEGTLVAIGRALQAKTKAHTMLPAGVGG